MEIWGVPFHYLPLLVYKEFFEIPSDVCLCDWCPVNSTGWSYYGVGTRTETLRENPYQGLEKMPQNFWISFDNSLFSFRMLDLLDWYGIVTSWKLTLYTVNLVWFYVSPIILVWNTFTHLHVGKERVLGITVDIVLGCENKVVSRNVSVSGAYFTDPVQDLAVPSRFLKYNCTTDLESRPPTTQVGRRTTL